MPPPPPPLVPLDAALEPKQPGPSSLELIIVMLGSNESPEGRARTTPNLSRHVHSWSGWDRG